MSKTFSCPKCGAPQAYQGGSAATIQCPYCETTLIVPPELRTGSSAPRDTWTHQSQALGEIKQLLAQDKKIEAIKKYRAHFGGGLKEAKDAVEAIERGQNVQVARFDVDDANSAQNITITTMPASAVKINSGQSRTGCATAVIVVVVLVIAGSIVLPFVLAGMDIFNALAPVVASPTRVAQATRAPTETSIPMPTLPPTPQFASAVKSFSQKGTAPGQLNDARSLAVDAQGNVYAGDYAGARIQRFDAQGNFQDQWTGNSKQLLFGLAADFRGNVYAAINGVINKFDGASGKLLAQYQYPENGDGFAEIAATPDGGLVGMWYEGRNGIITSLEGHREYLVRLDREGKVTQVIQGIISNQTDNLALDNSLTVDAKGNLYILTDQTEGTIFKFSPEGKLITRFGARGNEPGQINSGYGLAVDSKGRIYVATTDGVIVLTADGRYIDTFRNERGVTRALAFDAQDRLWILSNDKIIQFELNQ